MRGVLILVIAVMLGSAAHAQPNPYLPPPAPPVPPPPLPQPLPQVQPPEIAIPKGRAHPRPVPRRKGYGDQVVPCIERGRAYGLTDREMNEYVARCAGGR